MFLPNNLVEIQKANEESKKHQ